MKLSIIVPIYNVAPYLKKCADSLLAQDISDYEIILVDDGSTDDSGAIADEIVSKAMDNGQWAIDNESNRQLLIASPTLRVIHQENKGLSEARNTGTRIAQGDYIMYVDSDDYLQPNVLGTLLAQIEKDNLDILRYRYQNVKESGEIFLPYEGMKKDYNNYSSLPVDGLTFLNERMWIQCYAWQFILKTDIARMELFTPNIYFEDTDWTPRMLLQAKQAASTDLVVYNYLWREGSITLSQNDIVKQQKQLCDKINLLEKLNQWGRPVVDRSWFDGMISSLVMNIVGMIASTFYNERKEYIEQIKSIGILPISTYHIASKAKMKVRLINWSIEITVLIMRLRNNLIG